jgi:DMSO/TMAO reductase YedYZ heme-binding membrane subunit
MLLWWSMILGLSITNRLARAWRAIHFFSFVVFVLALLHGVFSGTDSSMPWAIWMYLGTGASVLAMWRLYCHQGCSGWPPRLWRTPR